MKGYEVTGSEKSPEESIDPEALLVEYLVEHSYDAKLLPNGTLAVHFGDPDRIPDLPAMHMCRNCGTPVKLRGDAGWRHEEGFHVRQGCMIVDPEFMEAAA